MLYDVVVLVADDVAVTLELRHKHEFCDHFLDEASEVRRDALLVHSGSQNVFDLALALWDGYSFERRFVCAAEVPAFDLEHLAEAALAKLPDDVPLPEYRFIFFVIVYIH